MAFFIIGCEIAFWVFVLAGLTSRYILRMKKLGAVLLYCTPLIDLVLIAASIIDLRNGATADFSHSLAAIYIGVSVAWGHRMIAWADARFAYRFAGGPRPPARPKYGAERGRYEWTGWLLHLLAFSIGVGLLYGMIAITGDAARTGTLQDTIRVWSIIVGIDAVISISYIIWPKQAKGTVNKDQ
ncbi:hypothetical protein C2I18_24565 [Paenibacillus sp. PK3_47]|uniref:hypothetical protein n=1 Tax=Paenibacillus sp. PK3_47 TaxID=2072642 RepID=UPI00201D3A93|nr:hypothetical protein [Paenibacillus sp. PK3_47]UQZ36425.1 hypothetical protein C2I18_24565 [Paenibacillus sp. PK3_47]